MIMHDVDQRSDAWRQLRLGRCTGSRIAEVVAQTKSGFSATRANYMAELIAERMTGVPYEKYVSPAMQFGIDNEREAILAYEFRTNTTVTAVGFVEHPSIKMAGCSPDGLIDEDGSIEVKVPNTATHIDTLLALRLPDKYVVQVQWLLACTGRQWCDYISFDPRMPEALRLYVRRIQRNEKRIEELEKSVAEFLNEVDQKVEGLTRLYQQEKAHEPA